MRIVVFWEEGFPFVDTRPQGRESLRAGVSAAQQADFVTSDLLSAALAAEPDLFVNPYGSAFPRAAVEALVAHLERGGAWLNVGGAPLTRLCSHGAGPGLAGGWQPEPRQADVLARLRLGDAAECPVPPDATFVCPPADAAIETVLHRYRPHLAWAFDPSLDGDDAAGLRDGWLRPVVLAEAQGMRVAAPVVAIDWARGRFAGGRWVLCACQSTRSASADLIRRLIDYAARPHAEVTVRPTFACYYPGEAPSLTVQVDSSSPADLRISVRVYCRDSQREAYAHLFRARADAGPAIVRSAPFAAPDPGIYIVRVSVEAQGLSKPIGTGDGGFWVYDRALLTRAEDRAAGSAGWAGIGVDYRPKDAPRDFLRAPTTAAWDSDLAAIAASGASWVEVAPQLAGPGRVLPDGTADEGVARAVTALALTARRHGLGVLLDVPDDAGCIQGPLVALAHRLQGAPGVCWRLPDDARCVAAVQTHAGLDSPVCAQPPHHAPRRAAGDRAGTETERARALERRLAVGLSTGDTSLHAGPWHPDGTPRLPLMRADGTEGPGLAVLRRLAAFTAATQALRVGRAPEETVVVATGAAWQDDGWRGHAAREAVRTLEHGLGVACRVAAETQLAELADARLVVVPSPARLGEACWAGVARAAERGAIVLVTGLVVEPGLLDPFEPAPVLAVDLLDLGDEAPLALCFGPGVRGEALRSATPADAPRLALRDTSRGRGRVLHAPAPVELAQPEAARHVYALAARAAGLTVLACQPGVLERRTNYAEHALVAAVNETDGPRAACQGSVELPPGRAALVMLRRSDGAVVRSLAPGGE